VALPAPAGDGPFARAARELDAIDALGARVRERARSPKREIPRGEALTQAIQDAVAAGAPEETP
jgi:hypothetical protein